MTKFFYLLLVIIVFTGCSENSEVGFEDAQIIEEPFLQTQRSTYLFSDFEGKNKPNLNLADKLVFKNITKGIDLQVNTTCLMNESKLEHSFKSNQKESYLILELLPFKVISGLKRNPKVYCDFFFKAFEGKSMFHRFKLTNVKIEDIQNKISIDLYGGHLKEIKQNEFPQNDFELYQKDTDHVWLDCENFKIRYTNSFSAINSFNGFIIDKAEFHNSSQSYIQNHKQTCRLVNYNIRTATGISKYFTLNLTYTPPQNTLTWRNLEKLNRNEMRSGVRIAEVTLKNISKNMQYYKLKGRYTDLLEQVLILGHDSQYSFAPINRGVNTKINRGIVFQKGNGFSILAVKPGEIVKWQFTSELSTYCTRSNTQKVLVYGYFMHFKNNNSMQILDGNLKTQIGSISFLNKYHWVGAKSSYGISFNKTPLNHTKINSVDRFLLLTKYEPICRAH